jgi:hypothetical protein
LGDHWDFSYSITNNRVTNTGYQYDHDGRTTRGGDPLTTYEYNAAGGMVKTARTAEFETLLSQDGVSGEAKRSQRIWDNSQVAW